MIGITDSLTLASAKLRSKRLLLLSTIVVSGILFAALFAAIIVFSGITRSINDYTDTALGGKYLVKSTPVIPQSVYGPSRIDPSADLVNELTTMQTNYIAAQKALAAQLKIPFDQSTIPPILVPNPFANKSLPESSRQMINFDSPVYQQYAQELQQNYAKVAKNKLSDLKNVASRYGAIGYYQNTQANTSLLTMTYLKDGKEDLSWLSQTGPANSDASIYGYITSSVRNSSYTFIDDSLVQRFILSANDQRKNSTAIPVIITTKEATDLFGAQLHIAPEPSGAAQQVAWMKVLQDKINGLTYSACYRNQADGTALTQAAQTLTNIEANKNNKSYILPSLIYNLPTTPCGDLTVKSDTRTDAEKNQAMQQDALHKALGIYQTPVHQLIRFQIVGVMPVTSQTDTATTLPTFLSGLLGAQYGLGAIIPAKMYDALPVSAQYKDILQGDSTSIHNTDVLQKAGIREAIVAFDSIDKARSFINTEGCSPANSNCDKLYTLEPYGANYLLMNTFKSTAASILQYAFTGVVGVAIVIIWFMMSRVIADSRRETAVFRAIGAKRRDIVCVYMFYSLGVALRILLFSIIIGTMVAFTAQYTFGNTATNYARASYGAINQVTDFSFIGFDPLLLYLALGIIIVCVIASLPSLVRNVRRNPIADMREE